MGKTNQWQTLRFSSNALTYFGNYIPNMYRHHTPLRPYPPPFPRTLPPNHKCGHYASYCNAFLSQKISNEHNLQAVQWSSQWSFNLFLPDQERSIYIVYRLLQTSMHLLPWVGLRNYLPKRKPTIDLSIFLHSCDFMNKEEKRADYKGVIHLQGFCSTAHTIQMETRQSDYKGFQHPALRVLGP